MKGAWSFMAAAALPASLLLALPTTASADDLCELFAEGGDISLITDGTEQFCVHQFTSSETFEVKQDLPVQHLIIGGGGGGGTGGGGGGGFLTDTLTRSAALYDVVVGRGGNASSGLGNRGESGHDSSVFDLIAGGGGGGGRANFLGGGSGLSGGDGRSAGGSGGGVGLSLANVFATGGSGSPGGFNGGGFNGSGNLVTGGGGGGAGGNGSFSNAGPGLTSTITGTSAIYASGGNATSGTQIHAGGGGNNLERGKDGIVILRYYVNSAPQADAGSGQGVMALTLTTLNATGSSDPDDNIESYAWEQIAGTGVTLDDPALIDPSFTAPQPANGEEEELVFELTVTDTFGLTSTDTVTITVQATAVLTATKTVAVFSEDGSNCSDLGAPPPAPSATPLAAIPGACIQYDIIVENDGPVAAEGVNLIDDLHDILNFQAAALGTTWGAGTVLDTTGCPGPACKIEVEDGIIPANSTVTLVIRALIN